MAQPSREGSWGFKKRLHEAGGTNKRPGGAASSQLCPRCWGESGAGSGQAISCFPLLSYLFEKQLYFLNRSLSPVSPCPTWARASAARGLRGSLRRQEARVPGVAQPGFSWLRWGSFLDPLQVTTAWQTVPAQGMTGPSSALEGWIKKQGRGWRGQGMDEIRLGSQTHGFSDLSPEHNTAGAPVCAPAK